MNGSLKATGSTKLTGSLDLTLAPNSQQLKVEKPANAKNIIELLNSLGYGDILESAGPSGSIQQKARDTERKTDINALATYMEVYFTDSGYYPTIAQINDPAWRKTNMKGLDDAALQDPNSNSKVLVASPTQNAYAYAATPAGCDGQSKPCTDYTLTATLEAGAPYAKHSLNGPN
jgi:Tfp pilus assembly protein PilE